MNNRRKQLMLASAKEYCKCVVEGKTLKYNQIVKNGNFNGTSEWSSSAGTFSASDNICSFDATAQNGDIRTIVYYDIVVGHKYLVYAEIKTTTATSNGVALYFGYSSPDRIGYVPSNTEWNKVCGIKQATAQGNSYLVFIRDFRASDRDTIYIRNAMCIDLTALGLDSINSVGEFYETDLGKYVAKGNYLPYEPNGKFIHAQSPINFSKAKYNQQANILSDSGTYYGMYYSSNTNGTITISGTSNYTGGDSNIYTIIASLTQKAGHKLLCYSTSSIFQILLYDNHGNYFEYQRQYAYIVPCQYDEDMYASIMPYDISLINNGATINETFNVMIIDLTELGLDNITSVEDFYKTELGITIKKGTYLPYTNTNKWLSYTSVFESGLTLYKGDKYKTYSIDSIEYNQLLETNSFANVDSSSVLDTFNIVANHKYIFIQKYSRECIYPYEDRDFQVYFYGDNIEAEYNINVRGNFIYEPNASDTCTLRIETYSEFGTPLNFSIMLIDLTALGLTNVNSVADFNKTKLGMFLSKGYYLSYTMTNKTIKDQIVRTFKEIDLSSFTWGSAVGVYYVALPKDIKVSGQAIAEKYANNDIFIAEYPYDNMNLVVRTNATPSGKALLELETPEIITDYPMDFVLSNDNLAFDDSFFNQNGTIFELPNGLIPVLENGIPKLEIIGDELGFVGIEYGNTPYPAQADVYFANGFRMSENQIAFTMTNNDGSNVLKVDERVYLVGKTLRVWVTTPRDIPDIMVSRRTINVESENEIDMDFTKE